MKKLLTFLFIAASIAAADTRPNIVVFLADDMGWGDSGCYGSKKILTPNIDKLATQGVRFTQCYAACGVCSPSRSSILTGRTPYRNGVWRHLSGNNEAHLRRSEITYPSLLKKAGYQTCHVGKWYLNSKDQFNTAEYPQPGDHGYDYWMATHNNAEPSHRNPNNFVRNGEPVGELTGYSALLVAAEAISWLEKKRDPKAPFALSIWVRRTKYSKSGTLSKKKARASGGKIEKNVPRPEPSFPTDLSLHLCHECGCGDSIWYFATLLP